jgi:hypothetical protein
VGGILVGYVIAQTPLDSVDPVAQAMADLRLVARCSVAGCAATHRSNLLTLDISALSIHI